MNARWAFVCCPDCGRMHGVVALKPRVPAPKGAAVSGDSGRSSGRVGTTPESVASRVQPGSRTPDSI